MSGTDTERRVVPIEEAIRRIGDAPMVHTFMGGGSFIIGADHDRESLIAKMRKYGVEESGDGASAMGHTLVVVQYPAFDGGTSPLFIEAKR